MSAIASVSERLTHRVKCRGIRCRFRAARDRLRAPFVTTPGLGIKGSLRARADGTSRQSRTRTLSPAFAPFVFPASFLSPSAPDTLMPSFFFLLPFRNQPRGRLRSDLFSSSWVRLASDYRFSSSLFSHRADKTVMLLRQGNVYDG